MQHPGPVHVLEAQDDFCYIYAALLLRKTLIGLLRQLIVEVATKAKVHHNVQVAF